MAEYIIKKEERIREAIKAREKEKKEREKQLTARTAGDEGARPKIKTFVRQNEQTFLFSTENY
jgi:hypothetical protein